MILLGMGHTEHFVGIVRDRRICDLFGVEEIPAQEHHRDGDILEVRANVATELAATGSATAALYQLAAKNKLDPVFPVAVERQVADLIRSDGIADPQLIDLTHLPFVTIDGADSMDLDQALFVEATAEGHRVHYALADASYYVSPGTPLHTEALLRGASYYLPGIMIPMLPRALSEGLVSLNANVLRRAVVFSMTLDGEGKCQHTEILSARIESRGKLSFSAVQDFYAGGDGFGPEVDTSLRMLSVVGHKRMQLAEERGVVRYRRREVSAKLSSGGVRFTATSAVRHEVELFNEQLSLLCNIEGARYLAERGADFVEPIYRVHPSPSVEKMQEFEQMLQALVHAQGLEPERWLWNSAHSLPLRQYLEELPREGPEGRIAMAIHRQAVMANVRSVFQTKAASHHGVGADVYARFSAPMREMVGVFLHRELLEAKVGHGSANPELRSKIVARANSARSVQRAVTSAGNRLVLEQLFIDAQKSQTLLSGTLMGAQGSKAYVRLDEPPIDIKVYLKLAPTHLIPSQDGTALLKDGASVFRLGDAVKIQVREKEETRDKWILEFDKS